MSGKFFLRKFLYRRQSVAGYVVAERDHNPARPQRLRRFVGNRHTPPAAAAPAQGRAWRLGGQRCRAARPRACGARRADRTRRQQSAGRRGPIPPGAAPWESGSRRRTGRAREEARSATLARSWTPCGSVPRKRGVRGGIPLGERLRKKSRKRP